MNDKIESAFQSAKQFTGRLKGVSVAGAKIAMRTRLWEEAPKFARLSLLQTVIRNGAHVGTVHALHAQANPDRLALVDKNTAWDFAETNDKINQVCHAFQRLVKTGNRPRVVLCMENRVEYALVWFALFRLGWPAVHASDASTESELRYLFGHSDAAIAVGSKKTIAHLEKAAPLRTTVFCVDDILPGSRAQQLQEVIATCPRTMYERQRKLPVENVVYTSGTTGKPKGAVRDFGRMGLKEMAEILERLPISLQERHLVVSKLYHSAGQAFLLIMAALGATIYLEDHFDPEAILKSIHENKITSVFMVPTMIARLLQLDDALFEKYPANDLQVLISGAGPFGQLLRERAIKRFGADAIYDFYGASELGWVTLLGGTEMLARPGSQGTPLRGQEIRVVDGTKVLPPNTMGLIQVRTYSRMEGYLGDVASSADVLSDDGWMTVDDTGYLDEDGYLYISGRSRDMIISGGVNIYPVEIEDVLARHPSVQDIAVVGASDEMWGERLVGCVVPEGEFNAKEIETWAREHLTSYKIPRVWMTLDELPRNATGKVVKRDLEIMAEQLDDAAAKATSSKAKKATEPKSAESKSEPKTAAKPKAKAKPKATAKPKAEAAPAASEKPKASVEPKPDVAPKTEAKPQAAAQSKTQAKPQATAKPKPASTPKGAKKKSRKR